MSNQPPCVIPLPQAAERLGMSVEILTGLISNDTLRVKAVRTGDGQIMLDEKDVERMAKAKALRDRLWAKVSKFEGETISIREAEELGVSYPTLYKCIELGYIRAEDKPSQGGRGNKRRLNKADVAYVAELAKRGGGRGHRLFTPETIPPHCLNGHS
jgi:predicted site-specific integrase-resolvase